MAGELIYRAVRDQRIPTHFDSIDTHCHFGEFTNFFIPENTLESQLRSMDQFRIRQAWVSSQVALFADFRGGNDAVAGILKRHPKRFLGMAVVNPNFPESIRDELNRCSEIHGFRGIKVHCPIHRHSIASSAYDAVWPFAVERNIPVLVHTLPGDMAAVRKLSLRYPELRMIIAHANQPEFDQCIEVLKGAPNVYTDITSSAFPFRFVERLVGSVGSAKILFGTDMPYLDPASQWGRLAFARISDEDKENIFFRNAEQILKSMETTERTIRDR